MKVILALKHTMGKDNSLMWRKASTLIKWWTKSQYYHVEMIVDNKWISSQTDSGVSVYDLLPLTDTNYDYYELEVPDQVKKKMALFWNFVYSQKDTGYDWKGIYLSQLLFLGNDSVNKWFCSEIVTRLLQILDCESVQTLRPNRVSPGQLYETLKSEMTKLDIKGS